MTAGSADRPAPALPPAWWEIRRWKRRKSVTRKAMRG